MKKKSYPFLFEKITKKIILIFLFLNFSSLLLAQDYSGRQSPCAAKAIPETKKGTVIFGKNAPRAIPQKEEDLTSLQKEARLYRSQGLEAQRVGNLELAMAFYKKALEMDPAYAVIYNDLGVIYETQKATALAEESYLKAIRIDPEYLSAYSNLALLYETRRDLEKAAFYWQKRIQLGLPDDPWTAKAKRRLEDINIILGKENTGIDEPLTSKRKQEILSLRKSLRDKEPKSKQSDKQLAKDYFEKAKLSYQQGDDLAAFTQASDALQLDPDNDKIVEFIGKVQKRLLIR